MIEAQMTKNVTMIMDRERYSSITGVYSSSWGDG